MSNKSDTATPDVTISVHEFRVRAIGMFLAGMWFCKLLEWAIGGFHV